MSLYINALRKLRERLLDSRRLRKHEVEQINDYLEAEDLFKARQLETVYEYQFCDRIEAEGLEDPPKSQWLLFWGGDVMCQQREYVSYTDKVNDRIDALRNVDRELAAVRGKLEDPPRSLIAKRKLQDEISILELKQSSIRESVIWAEEMAKSQLSWIQRQYEIRLTDDDRRWLEPPRFPITSLDGIPLYFDHPSYRFFPNEPSPYRKALIEVIDEIISKS